jgi:drug/metabolite transporter (DMT)-like permease
VRVQTTALLAALGAALGFALSTSLQHHAAGDAPESVRGAAALLRHLLSRPGWLLGQVLAFASFCLHALALHLGALAVVQPIVVSGIVLAVPIRAALTRQRPPTTEVGSVLLAAGGLAAFLVAAGSVTTREDGATGMPSLFVVATGVLFAAGVHLVAARTRGAALRAGLYGVVAGVLFGLVAGLVKLSLQTLDHDGLSGLLTGWAFWTLVILGLCGVAVNQQAYRVGALSASVPVLNVTNVLVVLTFGVLVFDEVPGHSPIALLVQAIALASIAAGLVGLSRHAKADPPRDGALVHRAAD